jgi:hypothetical protein
LIREEGGWGMAVAQSLVVRGCAAVAASLILAVCASAAQAQPGCPAGQEAHRTAQLYFGRTAAERAIVGDAAFRRFLDEDVTPRFPDGLTIMAGGDQWRGEENHLIREASKVVMVVLPKGRDSSSRVEAVRNAYKSRFHQDSVVTITQQACVSF